MILAGVRPPEYADLRAQRARRAAQAGRAMPAGSVDPEAPGDVAVGEPTQAEKSAVDIAPRPPSD